MFAHGKSGVGAGSCRLHVILFQRNGRGGGVREIIGQTCKDWATIRVARTAEDVIWMGSFRVLEHIWQR